MLQLQNMTPEEAKEKAIKYAEEIEAYRLAADLKRQAEYLKAFMKMVRDNG